MVDVYDAVSSSVGDAVAVRRLCDGAVSDSETVAVGRSVLVGVTTSDSVAESVSVVDTVSELVGVGSRVSVGLGDSECDGVCVMRSE
jgi:hypothetical protein